MPRSAQRRDAAARRCPEPKRQEDCRREWCPPICTHRCGSSAPTLAPTFDHSRRLCLYYIISAISPRKIRSLSQCLRLPGFARNRWFFFTAQQHFEIASTVFQDYGSSHCRRWDKLECITSHSQSTAAKQPSVFCCARLAVSLFLFPSQPTLRASAPPLRRCRAWNDAR